MKTDLKFLLLAICLMALFSACQDPANSAAEGNFVVEGTLKNYPNRMLTLYEVNGVSADTKDSVITDADGNFRLEYRGKEDAIFDLKTEDMLSISLIPQFDHLTIDADYEEIGAYKIKGNKESELLREYTLRVQRLYTEYIRNKEALKDMNIVMDREAWRLQEARTDKSLVNYRDYLKAYVDTSTVKPVKVYVAASLDPNGNYYYLSKLLPQLLEEMPDHNQTKYLARRLERASDDLVGKPAPELGGLFDDAEFQLEDVRGKVVVLYFWASYCEFSRMENEVFKELYPEMQQNGIELFSYSIDNDQEGIEEWRASIESGALPGKFHIRGEDGWNSAGVSSGKYYVQRLPATYLIDAGGIVRSKNIRADELKRDLKEIAEKYGSPNP